MLDDVWSDVFERSVDNEVFKLGIIQDLDFDGHGAGLPKALDFQVDEVHSQNPNIHPFLVLDLLNQILLVLEKLRLLSLMQLFPQLGVLQLTSLVKLDLPQLLLELGPLDLAQLLGIKVVYRLVLLIGGANIIGPHPSLGSSLDLRKEA